MTKRWPLRKHSAMFRHPPDIEDKRTLVTPRLGRPGRQAVLPRDPESALDEALRESFPASDCPSILLS